MRLSTFLTLFSSATFIAADITLPSAFSAAQNLARDAKDALNKRASAAVSAAEAQITPPATTPEEDEAEWLESARLLRIQAMAGDKDAETELAARSVGSPELAYLGSDGEPVVLGRSDQEDREFLKARDADEETYWVEVGEDGGLDVLGKRDETAADEEEGVGSDDFVPSEDDRYAFNTGPELETKRDVQDGAPYVYEDAAAEAVPLEARGFPAPASGHHAAHKHGHQHNKRFWNW